MRTMMRAFGLALATAVVIGSGLAEGAAIVGGSIIVATDGNVVAKYLGSTGAFTNELYLDSPANSLGLLFRTHSSPVGSTVDLGHFTAGTELIFRLFVTNTGNNFYTGAPSRNIDNKAHARVTDGYSPTETLVEFEDLLNTPEGNNGFNDLSFTFTNVVAAPVPEPSTLALWIGVLGVAGVVYRRRRS